MLYTAQNHTFAICAYKESRYLEECIISVMNQRVKSRVLIVTSTPNEHIRKLAEQYSIPLYIRNGKSDIAQDWNFACEQAASELVTITHQDDIYCEEYLQTVLEHVNRAEKPLIIFGDYGEIRGNDVVTDNRLLNVKKVMLFPMRGQKAWKNKFLRRRILSLGSPICCPSVTFVMDNIPGTVFKSGYQSDVDWQAWEMLSRLDGSFVYCNSLLMLHRIHEESETTRIIADSNRTKEDYEMYCRFWPEWIARLLVRFYAVSQKSNDI